MQKESVQIKACKNKARKKKARKKKACRKKAHDEKYLRECMHEENVTGMEKNEYIRKEWKHEKMHACMQKDSMHEESTHEEKYFYAWREIHDISSYAWRKRGCMKNNEYIKKE